MAQAALPAPTTINERLLGNGDTGRNGGSTSAGSAVATATFFIRGVGLNDFTANAAGSDPWLEVVGGVGSVRDAGDFDLTWYMPYVQDPVGRSTNNLQHVKLLKANYLNVRDLLGYDKVVMPLAALEIITSHLGQKEG